MILVYHPRSWLHAMPKNPRFFLTKDEVTKAHPEVTERDIVTACYGGPVTPEFVHLEEPQAPATPQPEVVDLTPTEVTPVAEPTVPTAEAESKDVTAVVAPKKTTKKTTKKSS